ncbi:hypothetical protein [Actinomadura rubrisoli]|uniref:Uncharacterized protein n=1 Tax=Actinomadura rubrisoli TaxID=2530368 RepID=A0A4R5C7L1_9ACTN|nr:hypothetical protein [Actinomadura rubrisoli]TDD93024.1 hypothetical protein E1298_10435 [Actinomadura rubrisoli]
MMRKAAAITAVMLAGSLLSTPAAHADGSYDCFFGDRTPTQDGYKISAHSCTGGGGVDVTIKVVSGSAAGGNRCRTAFSWNGFLTANGCRKE